MERVLPVLHYRFHNVRFPYTKYTYLYKPINIIYLYKPGVKIVKSFSVGHFYS